MKSKDETFVEYDPNKYIFTKTLNEELGLSVGHVNDMAYNRFGFRRLVSRNGSPRAMTVLPLEEADIIRAKILPLMEPGLICSSLLSRELGFYPQYIYERASALGIEPKMRRMPKKTRIARAACYTQDEIDRALAEVDIADTDIVLLNDLVDEYRTTIHMLQSRADALGIDVSNVTVPGVTGGRRLAISSQDAVNLRWVLDKVARKKIQFYLFQMDPVRNPTRIMVGKAKCFSSRDSGYSKAAPDRKLLGTWDMSPLSETRTKHEVIRKRNIIKSYASEVFDVKDVQEVYDRCCQLMGDPTHNG